MTGEREWDRLDLEIEVKTPWHIAAQRLAR